MESVRTTQRARPRTPRDDPPAEPPGHEDKITALATRMEWLGLTTPVVCRPKPGRRMVPRLAFALAADAEDRPPLAAVAAERIANAHNN
ncbi:MAG: hypothetical protein JWO31_382 [Phycisphaerales bacterium]|nr:hypothetical protein [Phycisphaerales bacterium]